VDLDRPVVVLAARDESTMRVLAPRFWENHSDIHPVSYTASSVDAHYIALRADVRALGQENVNPYRTAYHTYASVIVDATFRGDLPYWFRQGFVEMLSNTIVGSSELQFGRPVPTTIRTFKEGRFLLPEFLAMAPARVSGLSPVERTRFNAQAWGLVQYLLFGSPDRDRVSQFIERLLAGTPSVEAVENTFGSLDELDAAYRLYMGQGLFKFRVVKADTKISSKSFEEDLLAPAHAAAARGAFHAATQRPEEALGDISDIRKLEPGSAEAFEIEGKLLERGNKPDEARGAFEQAVTLQSENFYVYFRLAALSRRAGAAADNAAVERWLSRSVELNDAYAPAWAALASVRLQLRQPDDAVTAARKAVELQPEQASYRLTLARALWQMGNRSEALDEARRAAGSARTDAERRAAEAQVAAFEPASK
jgi:tetratricopeptide (TPR) repeat protein